MTPSRAKRPPGATTRPNPDLRAALAGLALQGLYANPDLSANNVGAPGEFHAILVHLAVRSADLLLEELAK